MKVIKKQNNSRMCLICGLDNKLGVQAAFYEMEDKSVMSLFSFKEEQQSYPGRVHGGMISAMLDELGARALWIYEPEQMAVTINLEVKYRRPVPYNEPLKAKGVIKKNTNRGMEAFMTISDMSDNVLAEGYGRYLKASNEAINDKMDAHEEMAYYVTDNILEIK